jgi:hypothetical protein
MGASEFSLADVFGNVRVFIMAIRSAVCFGPTQHTPVAHRMSRISHEVGALPYECEGRCITAIRGLIGRTDFKSPQAAVVQKLAITTLEAHGSVNFTPRCWLASRVAAALSAERGMCLVQ